MKYLTMLTLTLILSGCGPTGASKVDNKETDLVSYRDEANKVTCYRVLSREGLACLRD